MSKIAEALSTATTEDYEALGEKITERQAELDSLREVQKIIGLRLGIVKKKKWGGGRKAAEEKPEVSPDGKQPDAVEMEIPIGETKMEHYRKLVSEYLQANGPKPLAEICRRTGIPNGSITAVVKHSMFVKTALGYGLTKNHR
jgi:hypothetical protein